MHWDGYTIFSVVSGVALLLTALSPRQRTGTRAWMLIGGVGLIGYGIFVASQISGTYYFPMWVFVLPFLLAGRFLFASVGRARGSNASSGLPPSPIQPGTMKPPPARGGMMPPQSMAPPPPPARGGMMPPQSMAPPPAQGGMMPPPPAS